MRARDVKIAVIGAGISGLTAALRLQARHDVVVLEAADYLGGHTHTHDVEVAGERHAIDSGFIVFNHRTYPNFVALLAELGVESQPTDMSFGVRWDRRGLEYAGTGANGLFAQRGNLGSPAFWGLLRDWFRFNRQAQGLLNNLDDTTTIGEFFRRHRYGETFRRGYFLPLGSAVWSAPHIAFENFPLRFVIEFYRNHGMLGLPGRLQWRTIQGGSRRYVEAIVRRLRGSVRVNSPVAAVRRSSDGVELQIAGQAAERFEHAVFACHSDQALRILGHSATPVERAVLSAFPYQRNSALLHTDESMLPRSRRAWASWNYRVTDDDSQPASVTYDMTRLQRLPTGRRYLVTLNADAAVDPARVLKRMVYHHPIFTAGRTAAQQRHAELINHGRASFCGAYWGSGFHEDGVNSALAVCQVLNGPSPKLNSQPRLVHASV